MKLIVGLGNPDKKYEKTRHNIGWRVADALKDKNERWKKSKNSNCFYIRKIIEFQEMEIVKPLTFMNNSGLCVNSIFKKHNLKSEDIIIIHDDLDLPLGTIRIKLNGSSGGHKGVQSIIDNLKTDKFIRLKIGVANKNRDLVPAEKFVLEQFSHHEEKIIEKVIEKAKETIDNLLKGEIKKETIEVV